jgi:hypothetical protein
MTARFQNFPPARIIALGLVWLGTFSLLYTLGEESGAWLTLSLGGFHDLELFAGFAAALSALLALRSTPRRAPADPIG